MAIIFSTRSGDFSASSTWTGGVVPGVGDEARASVGHIININSSTTCDEVSNTSTGTGYFVLSSSGVILNASVTNKALSSITAPSLPVVLVTANSPSSVSVVGNITGPTNGANGGYGVQVSGTGTLNVSGTITGPTSALGTFGGVGRAIGLYVSGAARVNVTGSVAGAVINSTSSIENNNAGAIINIIGNITGGGFPPGGAFQPWAVSNRTTGIINITGTCTGGIFNGGDAVVNVSTGTINILGDCYGGSGTTARGVNNNSSGIVNIIGNIYGGATSSALTNNGIMAVSGAMYASEFVSAIGGGLRTQVSLLTGPFFISSIAGVNPNTATSWRWNSALNPNTFIQVPTENLGSLRNFVTPDNATNFPSASSVRSGITYGISNSLVGTCNVPPAGAVGLGIPVDNTVGTATLSPLDFWNTLTTSLTSNSATIGFRLNNTATTQTVNSLMVAYNNTP